MYIYFIFLYCVYVYIVFFFLVHDVSAITRYGFRNIFIKDFLVPGIFRYLIILVTTVSEYSC